MLLSGAVRLTGAGLLSWAGHPRVTGASSPSTREFQVVKAQLGASRKRNARSMPQMPPKQHLFFGLGKRNLSGPPISPPHPSKLRLAARSPEQEMEPRK